MLRQAPGYGWSVAVAADVQLGLPAFERWLADENPDVRWIVRQNLAKARLAARPRLGGARRGNAQGAIRAFLTRRHGRMGPGEGDRRQMIGRT